MGDRAKKAYNLKEPPEGVGTAGGSLYPSTHPEGLSSIKSSLEEFDCFGLTSQHAAWVSPLIGFSVIHRGSTKTRGNTGLKGLVCFRAPSVSQEANLERQKNKWRVTTFLEARSKTT
jgi:hypothetical protein